MVFLASLESLFSASGARAGTAVACPRTGSLEYCASIHPGWSHVSAGASVVGEAAVAGVLAALAERDTPLGSVHTHRCSRPDRGSFFCEKIFDLRESTLREGVVGVPFSKSYLDSGQKTFW